MRKLLLIKHAMPEIKPEVTAKLWTLSDFGRKQSTALAKQLKPYELKTIIASEEPKAAQTGEIIAKSLGVDFFLAPGLLEHDRSGGPFFASPAEFEQAVKQLFAQPDLLTWGNETAWQARDRFAKALKGVLGQHPKGNLAVVAHGTVITLLLAQHNDIDAFEFWRRFKLASFVEISLPDFKLCEVRVLDKEMNFVRQVYR